jgi:hypothetical protein
MGGPCSTYGGNVRRKQGFGGDPEGRRPLGRHGRRWEDNIKMDLEEDGCGSMGWIELAHDRDR